MLINDMIERGAKQFANRTAILFGDVTLTFAQVNDLANRLANALGRLGVTPGRRVGLLINNGPYSVSMDFACTKAGAIRVPLNPRLSVAEHTRMLAAMDVDLLIFGPDLVDRAQELEAALPRLQLLGLGAGADDPYMILDVPADADDATVRSAWKTALSSAHPDRARARGLPAEFIEVAEAKAAAINAAFTTVMRERRDLGLVAVG